MSKTEYQGWELEHFDNSSNFRKYQNYLLNKHVRLEQHPERRPRAVHFLPSIQSLLMDRQH